MAAVVNDRDVAIMGVSPRFTPPTDRGMYLTPPAAIFKLSADGKSASPSSFTFTANMLNLPGTVTWSTSGGISLTTSGNTAVLNFASFSAGSGTVTASITVDGQIFTQTATVTKIADGTSGAGTPGPRGAGHFYVTGSSWSDTIASAACPGGPTTNDVVTISNGSTFVNEKYWDGSAWQQQGIVINGQLIVPGSITTNLLNTNGLQVRDTNGRVIFDVNGLPSDIPVGGTAAGLLASRAANGDSAYAAVNNASTGLASRMSLAARNVMASAGGIVAGSLTYDTSGNRTGGNGVMWNQSGIAAYSPAGTPTFVVDATSGLITARAIQILGPGDVPILTSGLSLASQVATNPNLVARPSSWKGFRGGAPAGNAWLYFDTNSGVPAPASPPPNGEFVVMPGGNSSAVGQYCSDTLPIAANTWYTVSFWAWNQGTTTGGITVDVYGAGSSGYVDTNGIFATVPGNNGVGFFSFTEQMPSNGNMQQILRILSADPNQFLVWNIKVELGKKATPWCDNVITPQNIGSFMQPDSVDITYIRKASITDLSALNAYTGTLHVGAGGICVGDYTGYAWPAAGLSGAYFGAGGALFGNVNNGRFLQLYANGDIDAPGFSLHSGQLTLTNTVIVNPRVQTGFSVSVTNTQNTYYWTASHTNKSAYGGVFNANPANGSGNYSYNWSVSTNSICTVSLGGPPTNSQNSVFANSQGATGEFDFYITCTVTDNSTGISKTSTQLTTINFT